MVPANVLRIAIAAESAIIRRGLVSLLQSASNVVLVGETRELSELANICQQADPDVALLYCQENKINLKDTIAQIHQATPNIRVVALTHLEDPGSCEGLWEDERVTCLPLLVREDEFLDFLSRLGAQQLEPPSITDRVRSSSAIAQELAMAGEIQANILPEKVPEIPGWEIAARLIPARETSGDFYDFIPVTDKNWGIIVADVADKGIGAALFMTLTSTLFRGLAPRHPGLPGLTLQTVNERILSDTRGSMFVTAFLGVLEPNTGRFRYANAGHPPPLLIKSQKGKPIDRLSRTGMALGVQDDQLWTQKLVILMPGDVLVLYTDGVIEAQDSQGHLFGFHRLQDTVQRITGRRAKVILDAILTEIYRFTSGAPSQDDTAILVIRRKED